MKLRRCLDYVVLDVNEYLKLQRITTYASFKILVFHPHTHHPIPANPKSSVIRFFQKYAEGMEPNKLSTIVFPSRHVSLVICQ